MGMKLFYTGDYLSHKCRHFKPVVDNDGLYSIQLHIFFKQTKNNPCYVERMDFMNSLEASLRYLPYSHDIRFSMINYYYKRAAFFLNKGLVQLAHDSCRYVSSRRDFEGTV